MSKKKEMTLAEETALTQEVDYMLTLGEDENYLAVENLFDSAEIAIVKHVDVREVVALDIAQLKELISALQFIVDNSPAYARN